MAFYPPNTGTWIISGTVSGQPYSTETIVVDLAVAVTANIQTVPDGSTVTPTDDIQTWLHCAGIYDKNYTTLSEVLADSTTLATLIADNNATDYLVRSTTWATDLCADSTFMSYAGLNNYTSNTLLADSDWLNAICNSAYFESVLNVKVPTMTDDTHPSGIVSYDSERSGNEGFRAFDGVLNSDYNCWASAKTKNTNGIWIQYQFTSPLQIYKFGIQWASTWTSCSYTLKRSSDNNTFVDIDSFTDSVSSNDWIYHNISDVFTDSCYRVDITSQTGSNTYGGNVIEVQFYGRQDV